MDITESKSKETRTGEVCKCEKENMWSGTVTEMAGNWKKAQLWSCKMCNTHFNGIMN